MITRTSLAGLGLVGVLALTACGPSQEPKAPETPPPRAAPVAPAAPAAEVREDPTTTNVPASVLEARYTPHYRRCLETGDAAKGVTTAMADCIGAELKLQDGALNAEYQRAQYAMPTSEFMAVRQAQRQWIKDRDAKCHAAASSGGTLDRLTGPQCLLDETVKRTMALEEIAAEGGR